MTRRRSVGSKASPRAQTTRSRAQRPHAGRRRVEERAPTRRRDAFRACQPSPPPATETAQGSQTRQIVTHAVRRPAAKRLRLAVVRSGGACQMARTGDGGKGRRDADDKGRGDSAAGAPAFHSLTSIFAFAIFGAGRRRSSPFTRFPRRSDDVRAIGFWLICADRGLRETQHMNMLLSTEHRTAVWGHRLRGFRE